MKKYILAALFAILFQTSSAEKASLRIWYDQPAKRFEEAIPLGNGRLGIMVYGGIENEVLNLNEETMWGGGPTDTNPTPDAVTYLPKVRELLFQEKWNEAQKLLRNIQGPNSQSFVPMGDLHIRQTLQGKATDYTRDLNLENAISTVRFKVDTVEFTRETFVSAPDQVIVMKLKASAPKMLNIQVNGTTAFEGCSVQSISSNEFVVNGQLPRRIDSERRFPLEYKNKDGVGGMRYQYRIKAITTDGTCTTTPGLVINEATEITLYISAATSYNGFDKCPDREGRDEKEIASTYLYKALEKEYNTLREEHIADYQQYFNRISLNLYPTTNKDSIPTDIRLNAYKMGASDPELETIYFQFGRYLLISASRPGGIAMNLQGIWNKNKRPSWGCNYTVNINLQMNYWPAEPLGLSELTEPLIQQIKNMAVTGKEIARNFYQMDGWAAHHNSDIWAHTNPVGWKQGDPKWANWSLGSPWLSQHLYEHYRFTMDKDYLIQTAYPLMKGAAEFCEDWLVEKDGYLITAPSTSPENVFIDEHGKKGVVTIGSAMDLEIIWDLYNNLIEAANVVGEKEESIAHWKNIRDRLHPLRIGKKGNLIEWYKDWEDEDPHHRHVSHLFALHPGRQINPLTQPDLAAACRKTLDTRGDGGTGWSKAWKINFWARMLDGDRAYKLYRELLSKSTLPNLFDTHPPFQIDGNFGSIAGIGEMLIQSQFNELHLLPALPQAWSQGKVNGLCTRGAFVVDMQWKEGKLTDATITSKAGTPCTLRTQVPITVKGAHEKSERSGEYYLTTFQTQKGKQYTIKTK